MDVMKRTEIIRRAKGQQQLLQNQYDADDKDRKQYVKEKDKEHAAYHCGRMSGAMNGVAALEVVIGYLEEPK